MEVGEAGKSRVAHLEKGVGVDGVVVQEVKEGAMLMVVCHKQ